MSTSIANEDDPENSCDSSRSSSSSSSSSSSDSNSSSSCSSNNDDDSSSAASKSNDDSSSSSSENNDDEEEVSDNSSAEQSSESNSSNSENNDSESNDSQSEEDDEDPDEDEDEEEESSAADEEEDDYDEGSSSDSSRSSHSSSNKFRYSSVMIDKANNLRQRDTAIESTRHSDNDNLFTSLSKSPQSLPKISFMSGISENAVGKTMRSLPNRHATVPAPDTRPIPNKNHSFNNQKESNTSFPTLTKKPRTRPVKREELIDIPITELDKEILMAMGRIKRQKQRPSVDRLYNIICRLDIPELDSKDKIQTHLNDMIKRYLLAKVENPCKGFISYRELNSAIPIVAINNPLKSRVHLLEHIPKSTNKSTTANVPKSTPAKLNSSSHESIATPVKKSVSTSTMTYNSIDESIERVVRKFCTENEDNKVIKSNGSQPSQPHRTSERLRNTATCGMCGKSDKNVELITCSVCGMSGHSTCLGCSETLLKRIKEFPNWECPNCKKCPVCGIHDDETNIVCVVCDRAFHRLCLNNANSSNSVFLSKYTCDDCDRISTKKTSNSVSSPTTTSRHKSSTKIKIESSSSNNKLNSSKVRPEKQIHTIKTSHRRRIELKTTNTVEATTTLFNQINTDLHYKPNKINDFKADESSIDCLKREDFQKKYLGRRGRRKGSFHLKRDLVSYRVLASTQKSLANLNYHLVRPELESNKTSGDSLEDLNLYNKESVTNNLFDCDSQQPNGFNIQDDHDRENNEQHTSNDNHKTNNLLNSIIVDEDSKHTDDQNNIKDNMRKQNSKQMLITEFLIKNRDSSNQDDQSSLDEDDIVDKNHSNKTLKTPMTSTPKKKKRGKSSSRFTKSKKKNKSPKDPDATIIIEKNSSPELPLKKGKRSEQKSRSKSKSHAQNSPTEQTSFSDSNKSKLKNYRALSPPLALDASFEITEEDKELFQKVKQVSENRLSSIILTPLKTQSPSSKIDGEHQQLRCPAAIEIGNYEIETWYSSLYPHEYARLQKLFICEFCLKYMKSSDMLKRHLKKCFLKKPPGDEIYRSKQVIPNFHIKSPIYLSVYEVDGANAKWYCQNLCLLGKLFIDHKTLLFDVEHFLFYILTIDDIYGSHFVGYFSKEKFSTKRYNVSCIVTMPQFQRCGFGRFLIDFSYLLSKRENLTGTPEKPLSDLGKLSYLSYWRYKIYQYIDKYLKELPNTDEFRISVEDISYNTGLNVNDIASTLQWCNVFQNINSEWRLHFKEEEIEKCLQKPRIELSEENLIWTPLVSNEQQVYEDDDVYNVLFYDDTLEQNELSQIKSVQLPGKLKKKRRRRWNKAYNHTTNSKRRRSKPLKNDCTPTKNNGVGYEDEDSQMVSVSENEDDTEEDDDENNSEDNSIQPNCSKLTNGYLDSSTPKCDSKSSSSNQQAINNTDESSCDKLSKIESSTTIDNISDNEIEGKSSESSPFKIRKRKRSSSRSPFKKFKDSPNLMNGSSENVRTNGKPNKNHSDEINGETNANIISTDDEGNSNHAVQDHRLSSPNKSPRFNSTNCHFESPTARHRTSSNLSNGIF